MTACSPWVAVAAWVRVVVRCRVDGLETLAECGGLLGAASGESSPAGRLVRDCVIGSCEQPSSSVQVVVGAGLGDDGASGAGPLGQPGHRLRAGGVGRDQEATPTVVTTWAGPPSGYRRRGVGRARLRGGWGRRGRQSTWQRQTTVARLGPGRRHAVRLSLGQGQSPLFVLKVCAGETC